MAANLGGIGAASLDGVNGDVASGVDDGAGADDGAAGVGDVASGRDAERARGLDAGLARQRRVAAAGVDAGVFAGQIADLIGGQRDAGTQQ